MMNSAIWLILSLAVSGSAWANMPLDTAMAVEIGGIRQWIQIKGVDTGNPVLLFLHGGPGNSAMGYADKFTSELQKKFVVIQWDQRESGKTVTLNRSKAPLSVSLMEKDAIEIIHFLQLRFNQEKIYLMGHSWGGFLGLLISDHHPELLHAYIAISPMIDQLESERLSLKWLIDKCESEKNNEGLSQLSTVRIPFENGEQLFYHRYWLLHYMGTKTAVNRQVVLEWSNTWLTLFNEASAMNMFELAPSLGCPVYFFVGSKDIQTNHEITAAYYNKLKAEKKKFYLFEDTAHNLPTARPARLQETILKDVLISGQR